MATDDQIDDSADPEAAKNARIARIINKTLAVIALSIGIAMLMFFLHILGGME